MNRQLAVELDRMAAEDQRVRHALIDGTRSGAEPPPELVEEMRRIDEQNTARMREIVAEHGWPGRSLVGEKGSHHAWLLAQHADDAFQREALGLLTEAVAAGEASGSDLAYLTDRVRIHEGREQLYGTQMHQVGDEFVPFAIEDPVRVDERRAAVGLLPFADYLAGFKEGEMGASVGEQTRSYGDFGRFRPALAPGGPAGGAGIEPGTVVLAIASGKGGVGKSTVSLNLALALAERGLAVGVLDADFYGPDIPRMVNLKRSAPRERWLLGRAAAFGGGTMLEPVEELGLRLMSIGFLIGEDQSLAMAAPLLRSALLQLLTNVRWGPLDYLLIDMPPGTADLQQELIDLVDISGALVVVTPQDVAHLDGRKVLDMLDSSEVEVIGGVENMTELACPHCGEPVEIFPRVVEERSIWHAGVPRLASLALDPAVAQAAERGTPVFVSQPDGTQANVYRQLAAAVTEWSQQPRPTEFPGVRRQTVDIARDVNRDIN